MHPIKERENSLVLRALAWPAALLALASSVPAAAQSGYPSKPIRIISIFPPGGGNDGICRAVAQKMTEAMKQQIVVENRPGVPGMMAGKEAFPDGYTITFGTSGTLAVNPAVYSKLTYDPLRDYAMIHGGGIIPMVIPTFSNTWNANIATSPMAISAPNRSVVVTAVRHVRHTTSA